MDENKNGSDSWALLALFAMAASMNNPDASEEEPAMLQLRAPETMRFSDVRFVTPYIDKFAIEQLRAAAMNKKEAEKIRLDLLRDAAREEEDPEGDV